MHSCGNWKAFEATLNQNMTKLLVYLQTCKLKLSHTKKVTAAFHLYNKKAQCELSVYNSIRLLPFCGQIAHILLLSCGIEQKTVLASYTVEATYRLRMGAGAKTLLTDDLSLVYLTVQYCVPV